VTAKKIPIDYSRVGRDCIPCNVSKMNKFFLFFGGEGGALYWTV